MSTLAVLNAHTIAVASIYGRVAILSPFDGTCFVFPRDDYTITAIRTLAVLQNGNLVSVGENGVAKIWKTRTMACERTLGGKHSAPIVNAIALEGNRVLLQDSDQKIKIFCVQEGKYLDWVSGDGQFISSLVALEGGGFASGGRNGEVKLWNVSTGRCIKSFVVDAASDICGMASWSPGKLVVVTGSGAVKILDIESGNCVCMCKNLPCGLRNVFSLPGKIVVFQLDNGEVLIRKL